jgi:hypothetical protein
VSAAVKFGVSGGSGGGTGLGSDPLSFSDTVNNVVGPLTSAPTSPSKVGVSVLGVDQSPTSDFTTRLVVGGSAPGYYVCIATNSSAPGGGVFSGGANPGAGIATWVQPGDVFLITYEKP